MKPSRAMIGVQRHAALLCYLALYLGIVLLVLPPTFNAFLSDDGDYAITVLDWVENGRLRLTDFPSMTLIGHLSWGWLFAKVFGANHVVLRASTMVMAWIGAFALYVLVLRNRRKCNIAAFVAAAYVFNPLVFFYSYTFNTDIAGCSIILVFLAAAHRIGPLPSIKLALGMGVLAAFSFLIRQTAALPAILWGIWLFVLVCRRELRLAPLVIYGLTFGIPIVAYFLWLRIDYGWPIGYEKEFLNPSLLLNVKLVIVKVVRMCMAMVLYCLPVVMLLMNWRKSQRLALTLLVCLTFLATFCMFSFRSLLPVRPYWDVDLFDCGMGKLPEIEGLVPLLVSDKLPLSNVSPSLFELGAVAASSLGCLILGYAFIIRRNSILAMSYKSFNMSRMNGRNFAGIALLAQFGLALLVWIFYDRYFMPITMLLTVQFAVAPWMRQANLLLGNLVLLTLTTLTVLGIQDSKAQWEAGWKLAKQLEGESISSYNIWIGHQYFVAESYPPRLHEFLDAHDNRLRNLDRRDREKLVAWPRKAQYHIRALSTDQSFSTGLPNSSFSSWIRSYRFEVFKKENLAPYESTLPKLF
jgi:Dolichyl-phosphate-mannose-protein mannosyltransferase